jgi:hypothetical protein
MHDNPYRKLVHQDYSPMSDLLLNGLYDLIVVVLDDRTALVEGYHHQQQHFLLDQLDRIQTMD